MLNQDTSHSDLLMALLTHISKVSLLILAFVWQKKPMQKTSRLITVILIIFSNLIYSQGFAQDDIGVEAAQKYFTPGRSISSGSGRLLSLHYSSFLKSRAYKWGTATSQDKTGWQGLGVTYKIGEWTNSMDLNLRIDYLQYEVEDHKPIKLSFMPLVTFPDVKAEFPLYFGAGVGAGVFISQLERESTLTLDYSLLFGVRFTEIFGRGGFFLEGGIKDHLHVLSDGQFMGQYLGFGLVFSI